MSDLDVAFLYPPFFWYDLDFRILLLRSWLEHQGLSTAAVIRRDLETQAAFDDALVARSPRVLAVHIGWWGGEYAVFQRRWSMSLLDRLRDRLPGTITVACGDFGLHAPEQLLSRCPGLDACVVDDSFAVLPSVARARDRALSGVPGVRTRAGRGAPAPMLAGPPGEELDPIPSPFAGLADHTNYDFTYSTALGCPYACHFCRTRSSDGTVLRRFGIARVVSDLRAIAALMRDRAAAQAGGPATAACEVGMVLDSTGAATAISIEDQTFTLDRDRTLALCRAIADADIGVALGCTTRADHFDAELADALWAAGFRAVSFGVDALSPASLARSDRLRRLDQEPCPSRDAARYVARTRQGVAAAQARGLHVMASTVIGLPGATRQSDERMVEWAASTGARVQVVPWIRNPGPIDPGRPGMLEFPLPRARIERMRLPGSVRPGHLWHRVERLFPELDATEPARGAPVPMVVAVDAETAPSSAPLASLSSGAHAFVLGSAKDTRPVRDRLAPMPVVALVPERDARSEDPEVRFELETRRVPLERLVDARGRLSLARLAPPPLHPLTARAGGVFLVQIAGREGLGALERLSRAARRGMWARLPGHVASAVVIVPDACAFVPGATPVQDLRRLWLRGRQLHACRSGPAIAAAGASPAQIARGARAAHRKAVARRGCAGCPAVSSCGACACGAGATDGAYCGTMRRLAPMGPPALDLLARLPWLGMRATELELTVPEVAVPATRVLPDVLARRWRRAFGEDGARFAASASAALLVRGDARRRHVLVGRGGSVELPVAVATAFAAAQTGASPTRTVQRLREQAGVGARAARESLAQCLHAAIVVGAVPDG